MDTQKYRNLQEIISISIFIASRFLKVYTYNTKT